MTEMPNWLKKDYCILKVGEEYDIGKDQLYLSLRADMPKIVLSIRVDREDKLTYYTPEQIIVALRELANSLENKKQK